MDTGEYDDRSDDERAEEIEAIIECVSKVLPAEITGEIIINICAWMIGSFLAGNFPQQVLTCSEILRFLTDEEIDGGVALGQASEVPQ